MVILRAESTAACEIQAASALVVPKTLMTGNDEHDRGQRATSNVFNRLRDGCHRGEILVWAIEAQSCRPSCCRTLAHGLTSFILRTLHLPGSQISNRDLDSNGYPAERGDDDGAQSRCREAGRRVKMIARSRTRCAMAYCRSPVRGVEYILRYFIPLSCPHFVVRLPHPRGPIRLLWTTLVLSPGEKSRA